MGNYRKPYTAEFKQQMLELVQSGRRPAELAKEYGCNETTIRDWCNRAGVLIGLPAPGSLGNAEKEELLRLRKEVKRLQTERDILAKATAWFARQEGGIQK